MKTVLKGAEPATLTAYRIAVPNGGWEEMKNNPDYDGQATYHNCRSELLDQQGGLCAYCEIDIRDNNPLKCRVEHFHPKSDVTHIHNWALDWQNMLAVCNGGSYEHIATGGFYLEPLNQNLSCDAHKDKMIQSDKLPAQCEGWILNPIQIVALSNLFILDKSSGKLLPDADSCATHLAIPNNQLVSVEALVQNTIDMLNLNCERLSKSRLIVIRDIEKNKKKQRQTGVNAAQGMENLARRYFQARWQAFFTTIRLCLGQAAETRLQSINYQG